MTRFWPLLVLGAFLAACVRIAPAPVGAAPVGAAPVRAPLILQVGHSDGLEAVAFAPDDLLATSGATTTRIWNTKGELVRVLRGGGPLCWSNDGRFLAVGSSARGVDDQGVRLWDAKTWKLHKLLPQGRGGVAFSHDSRRFLCAWEGAGRQSGGAVFDTGTWEMVRVLPTKGWSGYGRGALSPDGRLALMVNSHTYEREKRVEIEVFEVESGQKAASLTGLRGVKSVAFAPDGKHIALGQERNTLTLWSLAAKTSRVLLDGPSGSGAIWPVYHVAFSSDGARLYATSDDQTTKVFDVQTGTLTRSIPSVGDNYLLAVSRDETRFARRGGRSILVGDAAGKLVFALPAAPPLVQSAVWSHKGQHLALCAGREVQVWNANPLKRVWSKPVLGEVSALRFAPNHLQVVLRAREEELESGTIWNFDRASGQLAGTSQLAFAPDALSRDGMWLGAHQLYGSEIHIGDARSGNKARVLKFGGQGMSFAFGPLDTLASASRDEEIAVWDLTSGQSRVVHRTSFANAFEARSLAFSPRGAFIAGAGFWGLRVWDVKVPRERPLLAQGSISALEFSPDETLLASGGESGNVALWVLAADGGQETRAIALGAHSDAVTSLAFSPDGQTLISSARDGTFKKWDVRSRALSATISFANGENQRGYLVESGGGKVENFLS